ncbi:1-phosphatidylinositol phosphodiesterase-like [Garra rufa]|uniref:1-phosphatidylinositol phosphodiesterase-like n=1 Tax=Garra rufa TaxID=137080 RepID=UPI003CCEE362
MGIPGKILCIWMLLLHNSIQQVFNDKKTLNLPANYKIGWMETLDDNKPISDITIPGTHDSLALHGGPMAECQAWSLEDQLRAGIRYLDLRVTGYKLIIMHGPIYQRTSLSEVLSTIRTFLKQSPSELVLVRIKPVFLFKSEVQNEVTKLIQNSNDIWIKSEVPKIGQVRGKIVFVQKNSFKLGITLFETDKKGDYKVLKIKDKQEKIKQHLKEAADQCPNSKTLSLSYSSGTSLNTYMTVFLLPKAVAKEINPWLYDNLPKISKNPKPCFGIIAMDFPGFDLVQKVIKFQT